MQKKLNIDAYISMAEENFSGADGYQDPNLENLDLGFEGEFGADGNEFFYADAAPSVAKVAAKQPTPYQVNVTNTTLLPATVVLFGMNTYLLTPNFGSSVGVIVTPAQTNVSYLELLQQSASQPFETSLIRVQTSNPSQLTQILTVTSKDANGQLCQIPIITQSYFSANQFQSTILDIPYPVKIDGNTYITFSILGNTTATYTFFPAEKINSSRILGGGSELQQYSAPAVPIAIPMFTGNPMAFNRRPARLVKPARR